MPEFLADAPPVLGNHIRLMVSNPLGAPTAGAVVASDEYATIDLGFGGMLWTMPVVLHPLTLMEGGATIDYDIPRVPLMVGTTLHGQALVLDPGAIWGMAFSPALRQTLGY